MLVLQLLVFQLCVVFILVISVGLAAVVTSPNDPFRAIAAQVQKKPEPPVCCLQPLQPAEHLEDEILLSFEEWKQKQSTLQDRERGANLPTRHTPERGVEYNHGDNGSEAPVTGTANSNETGDTNESTNAPIEPLSPHFRVPLNDRFNYANLECSARVHLAHKSAKSTSSILSSKRDRYMLSPCRPPNGERQFVVVELCEDIRIDTVQLANFEFFSGIFKDFRIGVAKTHVTDEKDWIDVGMFRAKNVRGVQSFHPTSLLDFYRFIRIEFLSHYGNEFYCPVSLLRVYGLTHLEQWKWDIWEQESRETAAAGGARTSADSILPDREPALENDSTPTARVTVSGDSTTPTSGVEAVENHPTILDSISSDTGKTVVSSHTRIPLSSGTDNYQETETEGFSTTSGPSILPKDAQASGSSRTSGASLTVIATPSTLPTQSAILSAGTMTLVLSEKASPTQYNFNNSISVPATNAHIDPSIDVSPSLVDSIPTSVVKFGSANTTTTRTTTGATVNNTVKSTPSSLSTHTSSPGGGGESIYRTIMNRLTALEANNTLYTKYVEQQMVGVRDVLKRLGEDVGRLEGISKAQSQMFQRTVRDWEKRQQQLQIDYRELVARVEYLSDEIILEKRLGIAQLCLLMTVLVFMGLTRGSRGPQPIPIEGPASMKEWRKRHLSFSGDWTSKFRGRERESEHSDLQTRRPALDDLAPDVKFAFPSKKDEDQVKMPLRPMSVNVPIPISMVHSISSDARARNGRSHTRSRTPSIRRKQYNTHQYQHRQPLTPTHPTHPHTNSYGFQKLRRSSSQTHSSDTSGVVMSVSSTHRSARKWARTAHLHEVRNMEQRKALADFWENVANGNRAAVEDDPFWVRKKAKNVVVAQGNVADKMVNKNGDMDTGEEMPTLKLQEENESDLWVDTDNEELEPTCNSR